MLSRLMQQIVINDFTLMTHPLGGSFPETNYNKSKTVTGVAPASELWRHLDMGVSRLNLAP
jgi:predicted cupin superfamily sugar epimerase